jgi:hypothetical protein
MTNEPRQKSGGFVYVMTNPAMPGLVKIGSTQLLPAKRARQLGGTGVPADFKVVAFRRFEDELRAERELQAMFHIHRVHSRREFFQVTIEEAQTALLQLSEAKLQRLPTFANGPKALDPVGGDDPPAKAKPMSYTNASVLGYPYWTRFNEMRADKNLLPRFENAGPRFFHRHFLVFPSKQNGKRNIHYEGRIRINDPQVSMRLILKTADNIKELFDIIAAEREEIERETKLPLRWLREQGRYESHIAVERDDMDPRDVGEWVRQHAWLSEVVSGFERALRSRVEKLPALPSA